MLYTTALALQFQHSVCAIDDFQSPWSAITAAQKLAWECQAFESADPDLRYRPTLSADRKSALRRPGTLPCNKSVRFQDSIEVMFNNVQAHVPHGYLQDRQNKPWRIPTEPSRQPAHTFQIQPGLCAPLSVMAVLSSPRTDLTRTFSSGEQHDAAQLQTSRSASTGSEPIDPPGEEAPDWIHDIWDQVFLRQADVDRVEDGPYITLMTWYLDHDLQRSCHRFRSIAFAQDWTSWLHQIQEVWSDLWSYSSPVDIQLVTPEPPRGSLEFHQAHLIITQNRAREKSILLTAIFEMDQGPKRAWRAALTTSSPTTRQDILDFIPGDQSRDSPFMWVVTDELVWGQGLTAVRHDASVEVYRGLSHTPPEEQLAARTRTHDGRDNLEEDEVTLMGRNPVITRPQEDAVPPEQDIEADTPDESAEELTDDGNEIPQDAEWQATVLFRIGTPGIHKRLRWNDYEVFHRQAAHYLEISRHELIALHHVATPPVDLRGLEAPVLAQIRGEQRAGSTAKYVLIDVEFHEHPPALVPDTDRQSKLIVRSVTREMLLSVLGLIPYCRHMQETCMVWHNHHYVRQDNASPLNLEHGDYIRISVPPSATCREIPTRLAALVHHHGYGEGDYRRFRITMPDHMDISQMPHPDGRLDHLPFDDVFNLIQLPPGVHQHKVPEDFSERLEPIIQENAARERAMWTQHLRALHPVFTTLHEHFLLAIE